MGKVQMEILGLSTSTAATNVYALILQEVDGARRLPIVIGHHEAQAIAIEMEGIAPPRPLTHDLFRSTLETLGSAVTEVIIHDFNETTFFAQIVLDDHIIVADSRPSDAIALAVRFGAPIYAEEAVLEDAAYIPDEDKSDIIHIKSPGTAPEQSKQPAEQSTTEPIATKETGTPTLEILQQQLQNAIANEDYELAATLRDEINRLSE